RKLDKGRGFDVAGEVGAETFEAGRAQRQAVQRPAQRLHRLAVEVNRPEMNHVSMALVGNLGSIVQVRPNRSHRFAKNGKHLKDIRAFEVGEYRLSIANDLLGSVGRIKDRPQHLLVAFGDNRVNDLVQV